MATFAQWHRTRPLRQVTWVCGPEEVLRREVARHFCDRLPGVPRSRFWAQGGDEAWLWDCILGGSSLRSRLITVHGAESLTMAGRLVPVLLDFIPDGHFVVFASAEDDFTRWGTLGGKDKQLASHLAAIRAHKEGQLIRCCRPSKEEELLKLIASWWPGGGANHASRLLDRCGGSLGAAWQACDTARRGKLPADDAHMDMVVPSSHPEGWAGLVIAGQRAQAVRQCAGMGQPEQLQALGALNTCLAQARSYARWSAGGMSPDEIARRGISRYRQKALVPYAARYDPVREARCRGLLAMAENAVRSGARDGVLEALAAQW